MPRFAYVWEYRVRRGRRAEFEAAYGPQGDWVRLFRGAPGYERTDLLRDAADGERYLTVDHWRSRADFDAFRARRGAEFEALDARCAELTESERELGDFESLD